MGSPIANSTPDACEVCVPLLSSDGELEDSTSAQSQPEDHDKTKQGWFEWFQQGIKSRPTSIFIRTIFFIIGLIVIEKTVEPRQAKVDEYLNLGFNIDATIGDKGLLRTQLNLAELPIYAILIILSVRIEVDDNVFFYKGVDALFEAMTLSAYVTVILKKLVGMPRPCFLDMCGWDGTNCTASDVVVWISRQSFPCCLSSSLATLATVCGFFCLRSLRQPRDQHYSWRMLRLAFFAVIACSTVYLPMQAVFDGLHRVEDVTAGLMIGFICGLVVVKMRTWDHLVKKEV